MIEVSETERRQVISRCAEFLGKIWSEVNDDQIECQRITSGVTNKTFHVWIKDWKRLDINNNIETNDVIVRIYNSGLFGKENKFKFNGEAGEAIIHLRLFGYGLASKLLGVFDGGRIEEYIPCRPVTVYELKSMELSKEVIRKLAKFHTLSMPISKNPNLLEKVSSIVKQTVIHSDYTEKFPNEIEVCKLIVNFPFEEEVSWMQQILPKVGHKVVLSHNDMNPNNILVKQNANNIGEKLLLVDYQYSTYFYRAYDLACFLHYRTVHIKMRNNKVEISLDKNDDSGNKELLQEYLDEYKKLSNRTFDPEYDNLQRFRMEVDFFDLVRNLLMIGAAKYFVNDSMIPFPVVLFGKAASEYKEKKQLLITKYGDPVHWK